MSHLDNEERPLDLLGTCRSGRFEVSIRILDARTETAYQPDDWKDSIIEVEAGAVEIETRHGQAVAFHAGDVFWLAELPVRALHNRGDIPAVLVTATRRRTPITGPVANVGLHRGCTDGTRPGQRYTRGATCGARCSHCDSITTRARGSGMTPVQPLAETAR